MLAAAVVIAALSVTSMLIPSTPQCSRAHESPLLTLGPEATAPNSHTTTKVLEPLFRQRKLGRCIIKT